MRAAPTFSSAHSYRKIAVVAANGTSHFIGRPGSWHSQVLVMEDMTVPRRLTVKGTGEVELLTAWGETRNGYIPIPQIHRLNACLIQHDFACLQLPPTQPGAPGTVTIAVTNGHRQQVIITCPPGLQVPPFEAVRAELSELIDELFPRSEKRPGLLKRLFKGKSASQQS